MRKIVSIFNSLIIAVTLSFSYFISGCGDGKIDISESEYNPKIVIDGYIFPGKKVDNIKITRNIPLSKNIDVKGIILYNSVVTVTDLQTGEIFTLSFNPSNLSFEDASDMLKIKNGRSYKLNVFSEIDGKVLHASSVTTVPSGGFKSELNDLGSMKYREKDADGNLRRFNISFVPSPDAAIHAFSITALDSSVSNFIYDNPVRKFDSTEVYEEMENFNHSSGWLQNTMYGAKNLNFEIEWLNIWFYGYYRVIMFAGDKNFKDFFLTHNNIMEMDGNFHEPKFHIDGDGIGVFGSAISDTVIFKILK